MGPLNIFPFTAKMVIFFIAEGDVKLSTGNEPEKRLLNKLKKANERQSPIEEVNAPVNKFSKTTKPIKSLTF
jgi:hypothetical protein